MVLAPNQPAGAPGAARQGEALHCNLSHHTFIIEGITYRQVCSPLHKNVASGEKTDIENANENVCRGGGLWWRRHWDWAQL